jgi:hypothetical protein
MRVQNVMLAHLAVGVALAICACALAAIAAVALRPPPVLSTTDQVAAPLRERQLDVARISIGERWPDHINFQYGERVFPYGYRVEVQLRDGRVAAGSLQCYHFESSCSVTFRGLGIRDARGPDITHPEALRLPRWLEPYRGLLETTVFGFEF